MRLGGAIRGISVTLGREGRGECCGYSEIFYVVAPPVSVKDRGVGTHEQILNVPIACRWYMPSKPSSLLLTDVWLKRTASMAVLGEKLRWVKWSHMGTAHRKRTPGVRGLACKAYVACWSSFPLQSVHRFESPRLSNMSDRLFVAIIK
jgi:hypothetical protein